MFEKILVAHDGSDGAQRTFDAAVDLASRLHSTLHMISVEEDLPRYAETMLEVDDEKEEEDTYFGLLVAQAKRRAALNGVALECSIVPGHEVKAIVDFAAQGAFDLLVVGSRVIPRCTSTCGAEPRTT
jgi:nucleotide-binding universal stress UspA family protein